MRIAAGGLAAVAAAACVAATAHAQPASDMPAMAYQPGMNPQLFLPVGYRCPPQRKGVVEVTKMSGIGARVRIRVTFDGETATHASVERTVGSRPFEMWQEFANPRQRPADEGIRGLLSTALSDADTVRMLVCFGAPELRTKYDNVIAHNRSHLRPPD